MAENFRRARVGQSIKGKALPKAGVLMKPAQIRGQTPAQWSLRSGALEDAGPDPNRRDSSAVAGIPGKEKSNWTFKEERVE